MKVHRYQIEVMWLILAVLGSWVDVDGLSGLPNQPIWHKSLQNKPPFTNQIRPPPFLG